MNITHPLVTASLGLKRNVFLLSSLMGNICRSKWQIINVHSIAGFVPSFFDLETINWRVLFCLVFLFECKHLIPVMYSSGFCRFLLFGIACNYFRINAPYSNSNSGNGVFVLVVRF